jgi:2-polyprenyl-6-methoxyphenol hydroxylase-like FAD-dependent oxidoreductase
VLIVGAGPTGLVLALSLARRTVPVRIISEAGGPGKFSRAMAVQARTLEFYDQFGFADEVIRQGIPVDRIHLRQGGGSTPGHEVVSVSFKDLGEGLSPYPFPLAYPQDDHERFLIGKLKDCGVGIEWSSALTGFTQDASGVHAVVKQDGHDVEIDANYICGCDGAHSCVRESQGIGFRGGTYQQLFYVADVKIASGFQRDLYLNLGEHILTLMFPVRLSGMQRLIGLVPPEMSAREELTFEDLRREQEELLDIRVTEVNWFSTYRVHHRVASRFRAGRAFLLGDAGHIHSPVGGQGMNTGIGDAVNLGWKLAQVLGERADAALLDSYEQERIGFAQALVSTTDRAFTPLVAEGVVGEFTRKILAPLFMTVMTRFALSRHAAFRVISQTRIHYADSPLSEGKAGEVEGGDRLPWVRSAGNFAPLRSLDWQVHVYGEIEDRFRSACRDLDLPVHGFVWTHDADKGGMKRDAAYLVRPDGYVAFACPEQDALRLRRFIDQRQLRFL